MSRKQRTFHALTSMALAVGASAAVALPANHTSAAPTTFVVDTLSDNPADGDTLREAVVASNMNAGDDTIVFADGLAGTITMLGGAEMQINGPTTIVGPGSELLTIDAVDASRHFNAPVAGVDLAISGMTLTRGASAGDGGSINMEDGSSLDLADVVVTDSNSKSGGALHVKNVDGDISIQESRFDRNSAAGLFASGGAVAILGAASTSTIEITDTDFVGNESVTGDAGAVLIDTMKRTVIVDGSTFEGNESHAGDVGALFAYGDRVVVRSSRFESNTADQDFGAVHIVSQDDLASLGSGTDVIGNTAANGQGGAGRVASVNGDVSVSGLVTGNRAVSTGGLILSASNGEVAVKNSTIDDNDSTVGIGNMVVVNSQSFHLFRSTVSGGNSPFTPGAFVSQVDSTHVERSTVSGNVAGGDAASGGAGLGVSHGGNGKLLVEQSTFSGNSTLGEGGAIRVTNIDADIEYSTIVGNDAGTQAGAIEYTGLSTVAIDHSILADNTSPAGAHISQPVAIDRSLADPGQGALFVGADNLVDVDPELGPLADNGGITLTHLPDFGSPVIDAAAPNQIWIANASDQRGFERPVGIGDLGSVEVQAPVWVPVEPARIVDTRGNGDTVDGQNEATGAFAAGEQRSITVAGRAGVPGDAAGVIANVTAVGPAADGYLTIDPCANPMPLAASLNYTAGVNLGNEVLIGLEAGDLCIFSFAATNVTVDVVGYVPAQSYYVPKEPRRYLDTRENGVTFDGEHEGMGAPGAGNHVEVKLGGRGKVDLDSTVMIYVAAVGAADDGFITIWDCQGDMPLASSLNYVAGVNRGNEVLAKTGPDGEVCIFTDDTINVTVDLVGYVPEFTNFTALDAPSRMLDTRSNGQTVDGLFAAGGPTVAGGSLELDLAGRGDIPSDAETVTINLTAIAPDEVGFVTAYPCGALPLAASLNHVPGVNGGNEIIASVDGTGTLCLFTSSSVHLAADVTGYTQA